MSIGQRTNCTVHHLGVTTVYIIQLCSRKGGVLYWLGTVGVGVAKSWEVERYWLGGVMLGSLLLGKRTAGEAY